MTRSADTLPQLRRRGNLPNMAPRRVGVTSASASCLDRLDCLILSQVSPVKTARPAERGKANTVTAGAPHAHPRRPRALKHARYGVRLVCGAASLELHNDTAAQTAVVDRG